MTDTAKLLAEALERIVGKAGGEPCRCYNPGTNECDYCEGRAELVAHKERTK